MREDMAKVITERPRSGWRDVPESPGYRRHLDRGRLREEGRLEDSPAREGIRGLKWGWNRKSFTDLLGPIVGFLRKNANRPWDKVWSELCACLDAGSTTQRHVLEHVTRDFVVLHTTLDDDGEVVRSDGRPLDRRLFYVCPRTRLLRHVRPARRPRNSCFTPRTTIDVSTAFHLVDGQWFEVTFAPIVDRGARDALLRRQVGASGWSKGAHWIDGGDVFAVSKRQLSRKEMKRLGLDTP
jgi:hypothetical protein